jgi:hypothetical protein
MSLLHEGEIMKLKILIVLTAIVTMLGWQAKAQNYDTNGDYVQTFAGSGFSGDVNGVGVQTMFNNPNIIVSDSHSNLFVWDSGNYKVKKVAPDGTVSTFATISGVSVQSMAIGSNDAIWLLSASHNFYTNLYEISSGAIVTRFDLTSFPISNINPIWSGLCLDSVGNIYLSSPWANRIYRYSTNGGMTIVAGSGNSGYADGNGIFTAFNFPTALAADAANNIYVWDALGASGNFLIRKIDQSQNVTTFAGIYQNSSSADGVGTNAAFNSICQMRFDDYGNLLLACGNCIRKISAATNVVTMAGSFSSATGVGYAYTNGPGNLARFNGANGVCISGGTIFVADSGNQRIRSITNNPTPQVVSGANLGIGTFVGVTITGVVGRTYQIQASPDMNTWSTVATVLLNSSPYLWIDQNPVSGNKFYRALLLP